MTLFNGWYYSWAPTVARAAASNPWFKDALRVGVVPLFGILYASYFSYLVVAPLSSEAGALLAGAVAASLIGLAYVAPVVWVGVRLLGLSRRLSGLRRLGAVPAVAWVAANGSLIGLAYLSGSGLLTGFATASLTLSMLSLGSAVGTLVMPSLKLPITSFAGFAVALKRFARAP